MFISVPGCSFRFLTKPTADTADLDY